METTKYDPAVIQKAADMLYAQAEKTVVTCTLVGIVVGLGAGWALDNRTLITRLIGAVIAGGLGFAIGQARAFSLRLQAQTALCQMRIEENTNKHAE